MSGGCARGTTMIECAAALVLTGMLCAELGRSLQASASILAASEMRTATIDVARNLLESEIGCPCGPPYSCPSAFVCSISRSGGGNGLDRLHGSAAVRRTGDAVELSVLVKPAACS